MKNSQKKDYLFVNKLAKNIKWTSNLSKNRNKSIRVGDGTVECKVDA